MSLRKKSKKSVQFEDTSKIEIGIEGENTRHFRITDVNYRLNQNDKSKQTKKPRFQPQRSLLPFGEGGSIYKDDSDDEKDFLNTVGDFVNDNDDQNSTEAQIETNYAFQKEKECYLRQLRQNSSPKCRIFGVYVTQKNAKRNLSVHVQNSVNDDVFGNLALRQPSLNSQDDVLRLSKRNLEMNASFVPNFVLNNWVDQILRKRLPTLKDKVTIDINCEEKIYGALLVADVSHFSKLARDYVRDDFKNVHNQNTRSIASEQLFKLLYQEIFNVLVSLIADAGGDIIKFVGDSIFAIFPVSMSSASRKKSTKDDTLYFSEGVKAIQAALHVVLKAYGELKRQVHYGLSFGWVNYYVVGNQRLEGFLSGEALLEATSCEEFSSKFSDNRSYVPLAVSATVANKLFKLEPLLHKYFRDPVSSKQNKSRKKYYLPLAKKINFIGKVFKNSGKEVTIARVVQEKLSRILREPRKCDILRSVLSLSTPKVVSSYVNLAGVSLWASELRVCTSLFILISGDWNHLNDKKLGLLNEIVSKIQDSVKEFGGEFLRFVIDDKGAQCFVTFGLRPKRLMNNGMRATLCAINIHEKIEYYRKENSIMYMKNSKRKISRRKTNMRLNTQKRKPKASLFDLCAGLNVCIGITTGKVICANVGARGRCEYTLHGECVNYANNLMSFAKKLPTSKSDNKKLFSTLKLVKGVPENSDKKIPLNAAIKSIPGFRPRILVGKEVYQATESHIEYQNYQQDVFAHKRPEERIKQNGEEVKGKAYIVKGTKLPNFSLTFHGEKRDKIKFGNETKLVGRIHMKSKLQLYIREFAEDQSDELWGVIRGHSGMGKTVALGQLYNQIKKYFDGKDRVIPFLIQSTCIESHSRFFVIRAVLLQLVQEFGRNLKNVWPKNLAQAYDYVVDCVKNLFPLKFSMYKYLLVAVFKPSGYQVIDGEFYKITVDFKELVKDLIGKSKCIFLFDDWHLMNSNVAGVMEMLATELKLGIIVSTDFKTKPFKDRNSSMVELILEPLSVKDLQSVGERWRKIPLELVRYVTEMVNGNPQHAEEVLQIVRKAGWIKKDLLNRERYLTLEAFSCIQDGRLEYRDFIMKKTQQQQKEVTDHFLSTVHKATYVLERMESTSKSARVANQSIKGYNLVAQHSKTSRSIRDRLTKPEEEDQVVNLKFTEYFDKNIYITEETLTNYLDDTNAIQHMCVKVAAVIGASFKLKHLVLVLKNFSDDVLDVRHYFQGKNQGAIKAVHGNEDLIRTSLTIALRGLVDKFIFKRTQPDQSYDEATFEFVTPLLREVTLNYMPQYLKQIIYRIITTQIIRGNFMETDFTTRLEYHRFVSVFSDLANELDALDICYQSMKEIETHAYLTGEIKYYFDSMSRLHAWHSFFIIKQERHTVESTIVGSSRNGLNALNQNNEALSEEVLLPFRNWYRNLDKVEIGRSLRIGAEKVLWYSEQSCADTHKNQRHARQIAKFGIKWLEPLLRTAQGKVRMEILLELAMLYTVEFHAKKTRKDSEHPALEKTCMLIHELKRRVGLSIIQEAEFALPCFLTLDLSDETKLERFSKQILALAAKAKESKLSLVEKKFVVYKLTRILVLIFRILSKQKASLEVRRACLVNEHGKIHDAILPLFEQIVVDTIALQDRCWREVKLKYLYCLSTVVKGEEEQESLSFQIQDLFRNEFGEKWVENQKLFVEEGILAELFTIAKPRRRT